MPLCKSKMRKLFISNSLADTSEEIQFMEMRLGETTFSEAKTKITGQGLKTHEEWWDKRYKLKTTITCYSHKEELAAIGFPYGECSIKDSEILAEFDCSSANTFGNSYSVGGYKVDRINLLFSRYMFINGSFVETSNPSEYRLFSGEYSIRFEGNSAINDGEEAYETLRSKLTKIYGDPIDIECEASWIKDKKVMEKHSIWRGENDTGIMLRCSPSISVDINKKRHDVRSIYLIYGKTNIYDIITFVDGGGSREGL